MLIQSERVPVSSVYMCTTLLTAKGFCVNCSIVCDADRNAWRLAWVDLVVWHLLPDSRAGICVIIAMLYVITCELRHEQDPFMMLQIQLQFHACGETKEMNNYNRCAISLLNCMKLLYCHQSVTWEPVQQTFHITHIHMLTWNLHCNYYYESLREGHHGVSHEINKHNTQHALPWDPNHLE